ncbi:putative 3-demethylubiquinone-9 3-methyltransferase [Xylariales sp. PMI_506]|nr:putative 3-demethylubiquinone-9 3-methyltransferase [Xylariales sp. PMI_506]
MALKSLTTCLWFDGQAEAAAQHYTSIFKNSKMNHTQKYHKDAGQEVHGQKPESPMTVSFELNGQKFVGLNGGPLFKHSEAVSFIVECDTQEEIDYYWEKLGDGGDESKRRCGWTADKFGVSWQIIPAKLYKMMSEGNQDAIGRVTKAFMQMKKMEIAILEKAFEGE